MKKFFFLLWCMLGISITYAEEVNIGLNVIDDESGEGVWLEVIPGYFFLDNNPVIYDNSVTWFSNDVVVYDYDLKPSTIHFNCEHINQHIDIADTRFDTYNDNYRPITQCFFNNDALYECITCDVTTVVNEWGVDEAYSNYRVVNQNGNVLYTFEIPEGYKYSVSPDFYKVSDDVIIVRIEFEKEYNIYDYCYCYYSLKVGQTGSMAPIRQMHEMKLNGNPISKGDDLIVTVGEGSRQSSIIVTSLSGAAIKEVPVIDGRAVISTSDLPVGLYVASQKGGASAKFIVK